MKKIGKILFGKAMGVLLAVAVMASMVFPLGAYAAEDNTTAVEDDTNTFVGTINGEDVIGYLDKTSKGYSSGITYQATFVTFDENGIPKYEILINVDKNIPLGTYCDTDPTNYGSYKISTSVYTEYNETKSQFGGLYWLRDTAKWSMELTKAEYADDGVFEGTYTEGAAVPSPYTKSPLYTEVGISGTFNYQMGKTHPTMETYRAEHPEYGSSKGSGAPSVGSSGGDTSSSGSSSSIDHTCRTCGGSGSCKKCYGSGWISNMYNGKLNKCPRCYGSGNCSVCYGTGSVY